MRVDLDAKVRTRDGEDVGSVHRAVVDPDKSEVTHFVISTGGLLGRDVLVERKELEEASTDGETIRLGLTRQEFENLPDFVPNDYVVPPVGWVPPMAYGYPAVGYLWPAAYAYPEAYPENEERGDVTPTLNKGDQVVDRDGEELGVVDDIQYDSGSGRLQGFVVRVGGTLRTLFGGGDTINLDAGVVQRIDQGVVYLRADRDEIKRRHEL